MSFMKNDYDPDTGERITPWEPCEYVKLAIKVLERELEDKDFAPLHVPTIASPHPPVKPGDLSDECDQELAGKLELSPTEWSNLNEDQRIGRMKVFLSVSQKPKNLSSKQPVDDSEWLRQSKVRQMLGLSWDAQVNRLIESGDLRSNGMSGKAKRIDPNSVVSYCLRKGIAFNET